MFRPGPGEMAKAAVEAMWTLVSFHLCAPLVFKRKTEILHGFYQITQQFPRHAAYFLPNKTCVYTHPPHPPRAVAADMHMSGAVELGRRIGPCRRCRRGPVTTYIAIMN